MTNLSKDIIDTKEEKNDSINQENSLFNYSLKSYDYSIQNKIDNNRLSSYNESQIVPLLINNFDTSFSFHKNEKQSFEGTHKDKKLKNEFFQINNINANNHSLIKKIFQTKNFKKNLIINDENKSENKKQLGRKRKNDNSIGVHNKFSDDNLRIKCKTLVLKNVMDFINKKIKIIYNGAIGISILKNELLTIRNDQISNTKAQFNKDFLNKEIGQIYSDDISKKFSNYPLDHNKRVIKRLENDEDEEKRVYFRKLFKLTFFECLKHFRGTQNIEELEGLEKLDKKKTQFSNDKEYEEKLTSYLMNYEDIINGKKSRKSRIKNEN
jgi:hypothetical protein